MEIFKDNVVEEGLLQKLRTKRAKLQQLEELLVARGLAHPTKIGLQCDDPFWAAVITAATAQINSLKYKMAKNILSSDNIKEVE